MKSVIVASLLLVTINLAQASFDLMVIPTSDGTINRYDPVNNIRLGSFGSGPAIKDLSINPLTKQLVALRGGTAALYNLNTGDRLGVTQIDAFSNHTVWNSANSSMTVVVPYVSSTFLDSIVFNPFGYQFSSPIGASLYNYLRVGSAGLGFTNSATPQLAYSPTGSGTPTLTSTFLTGITRMSPFQLGSSGYNYMTAQNASSTTLYAVINPGASASIGTANWSTTEFDLAQPTFVVPSHDGLYIMGKSSTSADWRIIDLGLLGGAAIQYNSRVLTGLTYTPARPAIILAPEPGTMIAIGLGIVAMVKRRRK